MHQDNSKQSQMKEKNCKNVVQTVPGLKKSFSDFVDGTLAFADSFALEDEVRNDYDLNKSEKVSTCCAVKLKAVSYVFNTGDIPLNNSVSSTACEKNAFVNGKISKELSIVSNLNLHYIVHTKEKPCKCDICYKAFSRNANYIVHTKEKPCKCDICYKAFSRNAILKSDITIHTRKKLFRCKICLKEFRVYFTLNVGLPYVPI